MHDAFTSKSVCCWWWCTVSCVGICCRLSTCNVCGSLDISYGEILIVYNRGCLLHVAELVEHRKD